MGLDCGKARIYRHQARRRGLAPTPLGKSFSPNRTDVPAVEPVAALEARIATAVMRTNVNRIGVSVRRKFL